MASFKLDLNEGRKDVLCSDGHYHDHWMYSSMHLFSPLESEHFRARALPDSTLSPQHSTPGLSQSRDSVHNRRWAEQQNIFQRHN